MCFEVVTNLFTCNWLIDSEIRNLVYWEFHSASIPLKNTLYITLLNEGVLVHVRHCMLDYHEDKVKLTSENLVYMRL